MSLRALPRPTRDPRRDVSRVRTGSDVWSPVSDVTAAVVMVAIVVVGVVVAARILA